MHRKQLLRITGEIKAPSQRCHACATGKISMTKFNKFKPWDYKPRRFGEVLHSDLCGPMETPSIHGYKYFMTIIDEFTRYCEVIFLKNKGESTPKFINHITKLQNAGHIIRQIHTDNGTEYLNTVM